MAQASMTGPGPKMETLELRKAKRLIRSHWALSGLSLRPGLPIQRGRVVPGPGEGGVFHGDAVCTPAWKARDTTCQT